MALPKISRQIFKLISKLPAIAHKGIVNNKTVLQAEYPDCPSLSQSKNQFFDLDDKDNLSIRFFNS